MTHSAEKPTFPTLSPAARRFLDEPRVGVVGTINPDGSVLQVPIWYRLEGDEIVFNSLVGRRWPTNLGRDPRVSFVVVRGNDYVSLQGRVQTDDDPERGLRVILELADRYVGTEAETSDREHFMTQRRVTFRLRPTRIFESLEES